MNLDKDEIDSYNQRRFLETKEPAKVDGITIFFAVVGAILFCWFLREQYVEWQVRLAVEEFNKQMLIIDAQSKSQLREFQIQSEQAKAENEERIKQEADKKELIKLQAIEVEKQRQAAIEAQTQEKSAKEEAWKNYYKPIAGCESENPNRDIIKCGNNYASSHKKFEAEWANNH